MLKIMMLRALFLISLAIAPTVVQAGERFAPTEIMDQFCEKLSDEEAAAKHIINSVNLKDYKNKNEIINAEAELKVTFERMARAYGKHVSCGLGSKSMMGDKVLRLNYIIIYQRVPVVFQGYFARVNDEMKMYKFDLSDEDKNFPYTTE